MKHEWTELIPRIEEGDGETEENEDGGSPPP